MVVYERFKAWQRCHELAIAVYDATKTWPKAELFGLSSQARRAAHSAAANIAEGSAKQGAREFRRYLDIALGSLSELSYTLRLARDLKILSNESWNHLEQLHTSAGGMTWLLYRSMLPQKSSRSAS